MTFSRLVLGEPRLRGKPSGGSVAAPCEEPLTYGANILTDPSMESVPVDSNNDIPVYDSSSPSSGVYYLDGSGPVTDSFQIMMLDSSSTSSEAVSTTIANKRSGIRNLRVKTEFVTSLVLVGQQLCDIDQAKPIWTTWAGYYTARVGPGDFVELGYYAYANGSTSTTAHSFWFYDSTQSAISNISSGSEAVANGSYTQHLFAQVAPAGSYYLVVRITPDPATGFEFVDLDDFSLEVQP